MNLYYCDLITGQDDCPKKESCKRWVSIKDVPYSEYDKYKFAQLKKICAKTNYKLYVKGSD